MAEIKHVKVYDEALEVDFSDGKSIRFEDCFLRDHCRCSSCYNAATFQRANHILDIPDVPLRDINFEKTHLIVTWDDKHESRYDAEFLAQFDYKTWMGSRRLKPVLWRGSNVADRVANVDVNEFLTTEGGAKKVFQSLLDYGIALVVGVEPTLAATEKVCVALGGVQHTLFGGMWEFTTNAVHADTAYTNLPLATHNDNTYFTEAAGIQVFQCLEHTGGSGGETILVDGFYGATRLKEDHPDDFQFLTTFNVEAEYIEEGHHHRYSAPVIKVDGNTDDLVQIRFNVYDRSPMAFSNGAECRAYYRSLRHLARFYENTSNQWILKLHPGMLLAIDNFRVLHGRTSFTGKRTLGGCYVARSDWLDRARTLKLIV